MTRRKKNKNKPDAIDKLQELSGIALGQFVYCHRYPDKLLARGYIINLYKTESEEFACLVDEITGQYRITLLEDIIADPSRKHIVSANLKISSNIKKVERAREKKKEKKRKR